MERPNFLGCANEEYIKTYTSKIVRIDEKDIKGYAAFVKIQEVNRPRFVGETCLYNNGFSEIEFLPDDEYWQLSAIYDDHDTIVEWYFDITRKNTVDEKGNPYCDDLYLDAVLLSDGQIIILDEDELKDALDNNYITENEFSMAYTVLNKLIENKTLDVTYMEMFCSRLRLIFQ